MHWLFSVLAITLSSWSVESSDGSSETQWRANANSLRGAKSSTIVPDEWMRGAVGDNPLSDLDASSRRLFGDQHEFKPLHCNSPDCNLGWSSWTAEGYDPEQETVVIPCGLCVIMDYDDADTLVFPHGLDVQGTLVFPNGYRLKIETPFVRVQGVLKMNSTSTVAAVPQIKVTMTGSDEQVAEFIPAERNMFACSPLGATTNPTPCSSDVGSKAFVVAGGRLDIRGLPGDCKTWVRLEEVIVPDELPTTDNFTRLPPATPDHPNPLCGSSSAYMSEDFETNLNPYGWTGGYGAPFEVSSEGTFLVSRRLSEEYHGPTWDLVHIRECLIPDQTYLFSARVRLWKTGVTDGSLTTCASSGTYCLALRSTVRTADSQTGRNKAEEEQGEMTEYGRWFNFQATFTFSSDELDPSAIYHILQLEGPEPGVDIEIDDLQFFLPSIDMVPDPTNVCGGNIVPNGDAESHAIHPYPIRTSGGYVTVQQEADGNQYFFNYGRSSDRDSITYELDAPGCLVENSRYRVGARIRVHSDHAVVSKIKLRIKLLSGDFRVLNLVDCPESSMSWVRCESEFTLMEDMSSVQSLQLEFEFSQAPHADVDIDDIHLSFVGGSISSIVVPASGILNCWGEGAEILVTSHTLRHDGGQVRRLVSPPTLLLESGMVRLDLNSSIVPPVTKQDSEHFAVEVALLSRNIVFEGAPDEDDELIGGHFIVMYTPRVLQYVEGIELRNFGQQGLLGRYPIHFHLCGDVNGAVVSKNSIRGSNQRCVVVHGTHNVTVVDNVAFDTRGHCYMTEDGGELDNLFERNLGAYARKALRLVRPFETDMSNPSTFWCSNPGNKWIGNVAAGCEANGFWFELQDSVRAPTADMPLSVGMKPRRMELGEFRDNVAHSNGRHGLRTYPNGYQPSIRAVFENTFSYKNGEEGIFFHNSRNLGVSGGVLADNRMQADFDRADNILMEGTTVIGVTAEYMNISQSQFDAPAHENLVIGVELHGFATDISSEGATIRSVHFSGFSETGSSHTALVEVDYKIRSGHFDYWTTLSGITVEDAPPAAYFDFAKAAAGGISDIYITDLDSSMNPQISDVTGTSSVVSASLQMTTFIDTEECEAFPERSLLYCRNTCLRTVTYATSPAETENFVLRVTDASNSSRYFDFPGYFYHETLNNRADGPPDDMRNTWFRKRRYFAAALPPGSFVARFLRDSQDSWPTHVEVTMERPQCEDSLSLDAIDLVRPDTVEGECFELVKNGDMEMSADSHIHWLHHEGGVELAVSQGIDDSNAIATVEANSERAFLVQFLDTRCIAVGQQYEVKAWVFLERNGSPFSCDVSDCPEIRLQIRSPTDDDGLYFSEDVFIIADQFIRPYNESGWNCLQGVFTVNPIIAAGASVALTLQRNRQNVKMYLDNVTASLIPEDDCGQLVFNGDFSSGTSEFWYKNSNNKNPRLEMTEDNTALMMLGRSSPSDSIVQSIRTGCFIESERYLVSAKFRLLQGDGSLFSCDPTKMDGNSACPRMLLRSFVDVGQESQQAHSHGGAGVADTDHGITSDGWNTISGIFSATEYDVRSERSELFFEEAPRGKDLVIDEVSITALPMDCSELFLNRDAEYDDTARFWRHAARGSGMKIEIDTSEDGNRFFRLFDRRDVGDGIVQSVDPRCMSTSSNWRLVAKMKLVSKSTGEGAACNPFDTRRDEGCPPISVLGFVDGTRVYDRWFHMTNYPTWSESSFNDYEVEFTVPPTLLSDCDDVVVGIRSYNLDWELHVDDMSLKPM